MVLGVLCGFGAAVFQSFSYIASRHFTQSRAKDGTLALLVLVHLWLGIMAAAVLPFVWIAGVPWRAALPSLIAAAVLNALGQVGLTLSIRMAEPSRVSPLLTMKVFLPAVLTTILGPPVGVAVNRYLSFWQWLAVGLCVIAGVSINRGGGGMRRAALAAIVVTSVIFGSSDWCIGIAIGDILKAPHISPIGASLLSGSCLYLMASMAGVALLISGWGRPPGQFFFSWPDWRDSFPYAATWYLAMVCLFLAFGQIGVVLGTILQCTRSFITILLGAGLMIIGLEHIEPKQPARVILTRIAAGVLMSLSISLYILREPSALWHHKTATSAVLLPIGSPVQK